MVIREIESYCQNDELTEKARNILERSNFNFKEKMQDRMKGMESKIRHFNFRMTKFRSRGGIENFNGNG